MQQIPTLDPDATECRHENYDESHDICSPETVWVQDPSIPKIATELVEGISARVVVLDGDFHELQVSRIHIGDVLSEDETDYLEIGDQRIPDNIIVSLEECMDEFVNVEDGVYRVVGAGPKIQGNPLNLPFNMFYFYDVAPAVLEDVPTDRAGLVEYLSKTQTKLGAGFARGRISGIVWHAQDGSGRMAKVRLGDLVAT